MALHHHSWRRSRDEARYFLFIYYLDRYCASLTYLVTHAPPAPSSIQVCASLAKRHECKRHFIINAEDAPEAMLDVAALLEVGPILPPTDEMLPTDGYLMQSCSQGLPAGSGAAPASSSELSTKMTLPPVLNERLPAGGGGGDYVISSARQPEADEDDVMSACGNQPPAGALLPAGVPECMRDAAALMDAPPFMTAGTTEVPAGGGYVMTAGTTEVPAGGDHVASNDDMSEGDDEVLSADEDEAEGNAADEAGPWAEAGGLHHIGMLHHDHLSMHVRVCACGGTCVYGFACVCVCAPGGGRRLTPYWYAWKRMCMCVVLHVQYDTRVYPYVRVSLHTRVSAVVSVSASASVSVSVCAYCMCLCVCVYVYTYGYVDTCKNMS